MWLMHLDVLCRQRIRGFTTMRYINLRFMYLLTYFNLSFALSLDILKYFEQLNGIGLVKLSQTYEL